MSDALCIHDGDGHVGIACVPGPFQYQPAVHRPWAREWEPIGKPVDTIAAAFHALGDVLDASRHRSYPRYNRAGIWAVEQGETYYDPEQVYEVSFR